MKGGHGNGDDTSYLDDYTAVTGTLHFQEDTFLACKLTAGDAYLCSLGKVQLLGTEVQEVVVVSAGNGDETLHLNIRDDDFLTATGIGDVLQVGDFRFHTFKVRRTGMHKEQVVDDGRQYADFLPSPDTYFILHGDKTTQFLLFQKTHGIRLPTVRGTHGVP